MNLLIRKMRNEVSWQGAISLNVFLVAAIFVSGQFITVQHSHDGDLTHQSDCSTCLKQGSEVYFLNVQKYSFSFLGRGVTFHSVNYEIASFPLIVANSRSPPAA
jgi:hypothetical protein